MNGNNGWAIRLYGGGVSIPTPIPGVKIPVPDVSPWFEKMFPKPRPEEPMVKGQPQEPASRLKPGESGVSAITRGVGEGIGTGIEKAVENVVGRFFSPDKVRDATVYLGAALLLIVAVWAMLR